MIITITSTEEARLQSSTNSLEHTICTLRDLIDIRDSYKKYNSSKCTILQYIMVSTC